MVNSIVEDRFKKGELDECPLTLRDLNLIKESFIRTLTGIFHGRTQYSEDQKAGGENAKSPPGQSGGPPSNKARLRPPSQAVRQAAAGATPEASPGHSASPAGARPRAPARHLTKNHSDKAAASENPMVGTAFDSPPAVDES
jgi:hypothetical protein